MTPNGKRRDRVTFQQRSLDANGDRLGAWDSANGFTRWARVKPKVGGEGVLQARLQGQHIVEISVLNDSSTDDIATAWRAVWKSVNYNIRNVLPSEDRSEFLILAEADQSDG
jgi:head-tail adaptor